MLRLRHLAFLFMLAATAGCSSSDEIDPYLSFNITRTATFPLSSAAQINIDSSITVTVPIDTNVYATEETGDSLLHSAWVSKIAIHSSDPAFTLDKFSYVRLLVGSDTVGYNATMLTSEDTLAVTRQDIVKDVQRTSLPVTLQFKLASAPTQPITITTDMTVVHTAQHTPFVQ